MKAKDLIEMFGKALVGIPIGVVMMMISYVSVYFIAGNDIFQNEMEQLKNIDTLIRQLIASGLVFYTILLLINLWKGICLNVKKLTIIDYVLEGVYLFTGFLAFFMLEYLANYSDIVEPISFVVIVLGTVFYCAIVAILEYIDKKMINARIKEKQSNN